MAMPLVAGREKLLDGHVNASPRCAPRLEALDCCLASIAVLLPGRNHVGNRFAVTGNRDCFTALNRAQELCKMGLGFGGLDFSHDINRLF